MSPTSEAPSNAAPPASTQTLLVNEIFHSIQGESTWAGVPMVFVRLTGCPLRCVWCDTTYAFHEGQKRSFDEVLAQVEAFGCPVVELTGGEPLAQANAYAFLTRLCDAGKTVLIETAGSHDLAPVDPRVHIIMDLKCPGSGEEKRNRYANIALLKPHKDEVKFVITDRADYEWAKAKIVEHNLAQRVKALLFSPVFGKLDYQTLSEWIIADRLPAPVRFQVQMHKHIWHPNTRGV